MKDLPIGWRRVALRKLADVRTGLALGRDSLRDPVRLLYLRVANVQDGYLDLTEVKTVAVQREEISRYSLQSGDVLLTEGGDFDKLGRGHIWRGEIPNCLHQNHVFCVRPDCSQLDPYFLSCLTSSPYGRTYFLGCAKKSTNLASINSTQLKEMPILLPSLDEQLAIGKRIQCWDAGVRHLTNLIAAKLRFKQGLMQQLLTGKQRFQEFAKAQRVSTPLHVVLEKVRKAVDIVPDRQYREIGIRSHGKGIFHKGPLLGSALGEKQVFWVQPDCLTLNIVFAWEQALAVTTEAECGMIASHRFPMFRPDASRVCPEYVLLYLLSPAGKLALELASPGGAGRNRTLSQTKFLKTIMPLPPLEEQQRVIAVVRAANEECRLLQRQLAAIREQKKGLLQKLLTGEVRVKVSP